MAELSTAGKLKCANAHNFSKDRILLPTLTSNGPRTRAMASNQQQACLTTIATSIALIDQFQKSLTTTPVTQIEGTENATDHPSPLLLLKAAAESLKSTTTKLSLLTITPPFTGSAVTSLLKPLNDSILPSLLTATLLVTSSLYPESFAAETTRLTRATLTEIGSLVGLVNQRAQDGKPKSDVGAASKQNITEATGKVWESCDALVQFANGGVPGFVVNKAEQWLALMKDAVQELQEWDPEEDVDEDIFGEVESDGDEQKEETKGSEEATIAAGVKDQALKVLSRIPQSIHVVVKQRLAKLPTTDKSQIEPRHKKTLDKIVKDVRQISECIDESAEAMYMGNPELCLKKAGEARSWTIDVVESVIPPWNQPANEAGGSKEDTFIKRALVWIQQVDPAPASNGKSS